MESSKEHEYKIHPIEVTGIKTTLIGTLIWLVTFVLLLIFRENLDENGKFHWILIALTGVILGLLGYGYTTRRAKAIGHNENFSGINSSKSEKLEQSKLIQDFE